MEETTKNNKEKEVIFTRKVKRSGNSLEISIPADIAEYLGLNIGDMIQITGRKMANKCSLEISTTSKKTKLLNSKI